MDKLVQNEYLLMHAICVYCIVRLLVIPMQGKHGITKRVMYGVCIGGALVIGILWQLIVRNNFAAR